MNRRGFLTGLAGIFAAGVAPAIVTQPMKIWVPKRSSIPLGFTQQLLDIHRSKLTGLGADFDGDSFFEPHLVNGKVVAYNFVSEPGINRALGFGSDIDWPKERTLLLPKITRIQTSNGRFA
jgi:hypothetical protein